MNPCGTCHWWKGVRDYNERPPLPAHDKGECHGGVPVGGRNEFRWPTTRRDDGCRGWEPVKT